MKIQDPNKIILAKKEKGELVIFIDLDGGLLFLGEIGSQDMQHRL